VSVAWLHFIAIVSLLRALQGSLLDRVDLKAVYAKQPVAQRQRNLLGPATQRRDPMRPLSVYYRRRQDVECMNLMWPDLATHFFVSAGFNKILTVKFKRGFFAYRPSCRAPHEGGWEKHPSFAIVFPSLFRTRRGLCAHAVEDGAVLWECPH
jgi:hypothetical protein